MPKTKKTMKKRAFEWDDRTPDGKKLDKEFTRSKEKDPMALEMGQGYPEGGKGLPKVKKESAVKEGCPRRPAMKEKAMKRRMTSKDFTKKDDEEMMREEAEAMPRRRGGRGSYAAERPMGMERHRGMRPYAADEEEGPEDEFAMEDLQLEDLDFGDLPELGEEEVQEVAECPPGCVPAEEEEEEGEEEEGEEEEEEGEEEKEEGEEEEGEGEEEEEEGEEKEEEAKEASVETPATVPDQFAFVLAEDQFNSVEVDDLEFPIFDPEGENPHYLILHKGEPVAKIALQDQPMPDEHRGPFLHDRYVQTLRASIARVGLGDTLRNVHAKVYAAQASRSRIAEEMKTAAKADMDEAFRNNMANLQDNYINTVAIAIEASVKNVILENPLKEALVVGMRKAGVSERGAVSIVEEAFREKGAEYFHHLAKTAEEWLGMPEEAQRQVAAMVSTAHYVHPQDRASDYVFDEDEQIHEADVEEPIRVPNNVPFRPVASPQEKRAGAQDAYEDVRSRLRGQLNVRGKLFSGNSR